MRRSLPGVFSLVAPHCQIPLSGTSVFWMGALCETVSIQVWFKWRNENQEIRLLGFSGGKKKRSKEGPRERSADVVEVATTTSTGEDTVGEKVVVLEESLTSQVQVLSPPRPPLSTGEKNCTPSSQKVIGCPLPSSSSNSLLSVTMPLRQDCKESQLVKPHFQPTAFLLCAAAAAPRLPTPPFPPRVSSLPQP